MPMFVPFDQLFPGRAPKRGKTFVRRPCEGGILQSGVAHATGQEDGKGKHILFLFSLEFHCTACTVLRHFLEGSCVDLLGVSAKSFPGRQQSINTR